MYSTNLLTFAAVCQTETYIWLTVDTDNFTFSFFFLGIIKDTEATAKNLDEGEEYEFRVIAVNEHGESEPLVTTEAIKAKHPFGKGIMWHLKAYTCFQDVFHGICQFCKVQSRSKHFPSYNPIKKWSNCFPLRPCSVYSMVDGSRQRFFPFVGGKKSKKKIYSLAVVGKFSLFSGDFDDILIEILPIW